MRGSILSILIFLIGPHAFGQSPREMPPISDILREMRASYLISMPGVEEPLLYHSFRLGYQVNETLRMGLGGDLSNSVSSTSTTWYDPCLYAELLSTSSPPAPYTTLSMSLPITRNSQEALRITSMVFTQSWLLSGRQSPWQWGIQYSLNPVFEHEPLSDGVRDRQLFFASIGHSLSLRLTDHWSLSSRSSFQIEHRRPVSAESPFLQVPFPESHQLGLTWSAALQALRVSVGASLQTVLFHPEARTSRIGGHLALGF